MVLQWPRLRIIEDFGLEEVALGQVARADLLGEPPDVGAAAEGPAAERPGEHRASRE